jgi:hypothetical protein
VLRARDVEQLVLRKWSVADLDGDTGLLSVVARLDHAPPFDLAECFGSGSDGPPWPPELELPVLDGALISLRVRPEDVVRYRDALRARIAAANRRYAEVVLPRALAHEAALRAKEEERRRIIADAQRQLDLDPALTEEGFGDYSYSPLSRVEGLAFRVGERSRD